jgi:hypothetical protein
MAMRHRGGPVRLGGRALALAWLLAQILVRPAAAVPPSSEQAAGDSAVRSPLEFEHRPPSPLFRGRPAPECAGFYLTEVSLAARLDHGSQKNMFGNAYWIVDIGAMGNHGSAAAFGGTAFVGLGDHRTRGGVKLRYRRWISRTLSFDLAPGVILGGKENPYLLKLPGGVLQVSVMKGDLVGITVQLEAMRVEHDRTREKSTDLAIYTGAKTGSYATLAAAAGGALFLLIRGIEFLGSY